MSNQRQRKAKIKAKQEAMRGEHVDREEIQTEGLDEVMREKGRSDDPKSAQRAMNEVMSSYKKGDADLDPRLLQLFKDFKRYRVFVVAGVVLGFCIVLASMGLYHAGSIDEEIQNNLIIFGNVVLVAVMAVAFGRVRPIKEDINAWNKVNDIALAASHGKHGATQADIDKIFWARERNKHVPPTPEFKKVRMVWMLFVGVGAVLMLAAVVLASRNMGDVTVPVVIIIVSFVFLLVAAYIERRKMKPLRQEWTAEIDRKVKQARKATNAGKGKRR